MAGIIENGQIVSKFVAPMSIVSNQPVFVSDSISLKRQTGSTAAQRWEISTRLEPTNSSADLFLHSVTKNFNTVFEIQMPQIYRSAANSSSSTSVLLVDGNFESNSTFINVKSNNGKIAKGEFIKFSNHDKVYLVTSDLSFNGVLSIFPKLNKNVTNNTTIIYGKNVRMKARYDTNTLTGINYEDGILASIGVVGFIEAL